MTPFLSHLLHSIIALLAIMNPIGCAPIFGTMVSPMNRSEKMRAALWTSMIILAILVGSALMGKSLLHVFGISMSAFRIGGGIIITGVGLRMLSGAQSDEIESHADNEGIRENLVVPFALPMVAGPGTITTVISLTSRESNTIPVATRTAVGIASALVLVTLMMYVRLEKFLHRMVLRVLTRFMGLILVAMGVQFVLAGWTDYSKSNLVASLL